MSVHADSFIKTLLLTKEKCQFHLIFFFLLALLSRVFSDQHILYETHGASFPSPRCSVVSHPLPLTPPAHDQQDGATAAQQHCDTDGHCNQQGVSGYVPPRSQTPEGVLSTVTLDFLTARSEVPPQAALGVIGIWLAALYVAHMGCGSWRAGVHLREGGGVMMAWGCGGLCSCGRRGRSGFGIVRAEGCCCGG